ncbi:hypothetical protein BKA80DRAFT_286003 [Phyllosticta citrichinensis]
MMRSTRQLLQETQKADPILHPQQGPVTAVVAVRVSEKRRETTSTSTPNQDNTLKKNKHPKHQNSSHTTLSRPLPQRFPSLTHSRLVHNQPNRRRHAIAPPLTPPHTRQAPAAAIAAKHDRRALLPAIAAQLDDLSDGPARAAAPQRRHQLVDAPLDIGADDAEVPVRPRRDADTRAGSGLLFAAVLAVGGRCCLPWLQPRFAEDVQLGVRGGVQRVGACALAAGDASAGDRQGGGVFVVGVFLVGGGGRRGF